MKSNPFKAASKPDPDPKATLLESAPESNRWNPVPGSPGHKVPVTPSEDDEGRSDNEALVEAGIADAETDQGVRATRAAAKKDL